MALNVSTVPTTPKLAPMTDAPLVDAVVNPLRPFTTESVNDFTFFAFSDSFHL